MNDHRGRVHNHVPAIFLSETVALRGFGFQFFTTEAQKPEVLSRTLGAGAYARRLLPCAERHASPHGGPLVVGIDLEHAA